MTTILLLASIQALFLAILVFAKKNKQLSDMILGVWLTLIAVHVAIYFADAKLGVLSPSLLNLNAGFPFLQGPFLFLYVKTLTDHGARIRSSYIYHFIPYILHVGYLYFVLNSFSSNPDGLQITIHIFEQPAFFNILLLGSVPFYAGWSFILLRAFRLNILSTFSSIEKINLDWLRYLIYGMGLVWLIVIIVFLTVKIQGSGQSHDVRHLIFVALTVFVYAIGYFGLKQTAIFSNMLLYTNQADLSEVNKLIEVKLVKTSNPADSQKYKKSSLKDNEASAVLKSLRAYMEANKPYMDDQLTLPELADALTVSVNHLSQVINELCQQNFFDFVNAYRVDEVKRKLQDPKNEVFSLLSIAYDCGFGSKSAFNQIFKYNTGQTPTQFKQHLNKS
ncbi:AraC family transcriptional regulator [bacterium]|nr:AraC family transcriptional regulator [bacterium]